MKCSSFFCTYLSASKVFVIQMNEYAKDRSIETFIVILQLLLEMAYISSNKLIIIIITIIINIWRERTGRSCTCL